MKKDPLKSSNDKEKNKHSRPAYSALSGNEDLTDTPRYVPKKISPEAERRMREFFGRLVSKKNGKDISSGEGADSENSADKPS